MKLTKLEYAILLLCILIISFAALYLYDDFRVKPSAGTGEEQGLITYKYKIAQRKLPSRMIWEDVEQMFPVYNKDSIRTDQLSEAIVTLKNGLNIELDPESMFVLLIKDKKVNLDVKQGSFYITGTSQSGPIEANYNSAKIAMEDGMFRVTEMGDNLEIQSHRGEATLEIGNKKEIVKEGELAVISVTNQTISKSAVRFTGMKPDHNTRYFTSGNDKEVLFQWDKYPVPLMQLEVSNERYFKTILILRQVQENSTNQAFPEGIYYWRLSVPNTNDRSEVRKFRVIKNLPVNLLSPLNKEKIDYENGKGLVNFSWNKIEASSYIIEVSNNEKFEPVVYRSSIKRTYLSLSLEPGSYFWRVNTESIISGASTRSETFQFEVENGQAKTVALKEEPIKTPEPPAVKEVKEVKPAQIQPINNLPPKPEEAKTPVSAALLKPVAIYPANGGTVDMNTMNSLPFRWKKVDGAASYYLKLYQRTTSGNSLVFDASTTTPEYTFSDLSKLDVGSFYWVVEAVATDTSKNSTSNFKFQITLDNQPAAPETISKGKKEESGN